MLLAVDKDFLVCHLQLACLLLLFACFSTTTTTIWNNIYSLFLCLEEMHLWSNYVALLLVHTPGLLVGLLSCFFLLFIAQFFFFLCKIVKNLFIWWGFILIFLPLPPKKQKVERKTNNNKKWGLKHILILSRENVFKLFEIFLAICCHNVVFNIFKMRESERERERNIINNI